jgi:flagellar protein FlgJ
MDIKALTDVDVYTDFGGLNALRHQVNSNPDMAKKEVSEQFESLLVQMLMKSMRDANRTLSADSSMDAQTGIYQDLFDKQLSLAVSHSGTGLAKVIEASMEQSQKMKTTPVPTSIVSKSRESVNVSEPTTATPVVANATKPFDSTGNFVKTLWSSAKEAAAVLGTDPKFLLAQAALETNWGKSILSMSAGQSTHNLFNIKADKSWEATSAEVNATEYQDGEMVHRPSSFRAYDSYQDSFKDYVEFLRSNSRYDEALKCASNPHQFADQLQKASYATDPHYSEKIMQIYSSKRLNDLVTEQHLI